MPASPTQSEKPSPITWTQVRSDWVILLAAGFGTGTARVAPGTVGTLVGVLLVALLAWTSTLVLWVATVLVCLGGIWICAQGAARLSVHDHPGIVWDEIGGFMVAMAIVPITPLNLLIAFVAFRIADIFKPWPANLVDQRVSGGLGIMLDDVVAGIYAAGVTWLVVGWIG